VTLRHVQRRETFKSGGKKKHEKRENKKHVTKLEGELSQN